MRTKLRGERCISLTKFYEIYSYRGIADLWPCSISYGAIARRIRAIEKGEKVQVFLFIDKEDNVKYAFTKDVLPWGIK